MVVLAEKLKDSFDGRIVLDTSSSSPTCTSFLCLVIILLITNNFNNFMRSEMIAACRVVLSLIDLRLRVDDDKNDEGYY